MPLTFPDRLHRACGAADSLACVGLDPDPSKLPPDLARDPKPFLAFGRRVVEATRGIAAAYKPQVAFYSALGKEDELAATIAFIRERAPEALIILDAKRNDIGNTAEAYAREAFDRYAADAVTVSPYMGEDSVAPFLSRPDRGAVLLCRTSNSGARDFRISSSREPRCTAGSRSEPPRVGTRIEISCSWSVRPIRRKWRSCAGRIRICGSWCRESGRRAVICRRPWPRVSMRGARGC